MSATEMLTELTRIASNIADNLQSSKSETQILKADLAKAESEIKRLEGKINLLLDIIKVKDSRIEELSPAKNKPAPHRQPFKKGDWILIENGHTAKIIDDIPEPAHETIQCLMRVTTIQDQWIHGYMPMLHIDAQRRRLTLSDCESVRLCRKQDHAKIRQHVNLTHNWPKHIWNNKGPEFIKKQEKTTHD